MTTVNIKLLQEAGKCQGADFIKSKTGIAVNMNRNMG